MSEQKFEPYQQVLVRDNVEEMWDISLYSRYNKGGFLPYVCINSVSWRYCIPFIGNEHLLGTCNSPEEKEKFEFGDKVMVRNGNSPWIRATFVCYDHSDNVRCYKACTTNCVLGFQYCKKGWDDDDE